MLDVICIIKHLGILILGQVSAEPDAMQALNKTTKSLQAQNFDWVKYAFNTAQNQLAAVTFQFTSSSHSKAVEHAGEQCFDS